MSCPTLVSEHHRRHLFTVLSVLAACVLASCRSTPAPPATSAVSPDTWATVDGRPITRETVEKAFRRTQDAPPTLSNEERLTAELALLNELIAQDLLLAKGRELKIEISDTEVDNAYNEAKKNISEARFEEELTRRNVTAADMRDGLRRELLTQKVIDREVVSKIAVTDQDVSDFFNANRAQFNVAEEAYHLAQIVVTPVREPQVGNRTGNDAATPEQANAKTGMLMERLKAGVSFNELAMDFSEDPDSAQRGGDLGFVPVSRLKQAPAAMRNAVLDKAPGTVNVLSLNGAHTIVLVVAHELAGQRDLSMPAVRERITATLKERREQLLRAAYLTALRSDAKVVNYLARRLVETQGEMPSLGPAKPGAK